MPRTVAERIIDGLRNFSQKLETMFSTRVSIWDAKPTGPCEHSTQDHYIRGGVLRCSECEAQQPLHLRRRQGGRKNVDKGQLGPSG